MLSGVKRRKSRRRVADQATRGDLGVALFSSRRALRLYSARCLFSESPSGSGFPKISNFDSRSEMSALSAKSTQGPSSSSTVGKRRLANRSIRFGYGNISEPAFHLASPFTA
jgi:hypothetical protein